MASMAPVAKQQYFDHNGDPLAGGKVYTYAAGTTTPLATYSDKAGTTPNTNPIVLDARGEATIYWSAASYNVVLKTTADAEIWTQDNFTPPLADLAGAGGSASVGHTDFINPSPTTGYEKTVKDELDYGPVSVLRLIKTGEIDDIRAGTSTYDCAADLSNANGKGVDLFFPKGTYLVKTNLTLSVDLIFEGGAKLMADTGVTITISGDITAADRNHIFDWTGTGTYSISGVRRVSVMWFGASGSAGVDSQPKFQMAVNALAVGDVFAPANTYEIHSQILVNKSRIGLIGAGEQSTFLTKKSLTANVIRFVPTDPTTTVISDVKVKDIAFQTATADVHTAGAMINVECGQRVDIENIFLVNPYYGIHFRSCQYVDVTDVDVSHNVLQGFQSIASFRCDENSAGLKRENSNMFFTSCQARGSTGTFNNDYGWLIQASDGIWLDGCYTGANRLAGVFVQPQLADSNVSGIKLDNTWIDPCSAAGVNVLISGGTTGIFGLITITDCMLHGANSSVNAIKLIPNAGTTIKQVKINDNQCYFFDSTGILVVGNGTVSLRGATINGNTLTEVGTTSGNGIVLDDCVQFSCCNNVSGYKIAGTTSGADYGIAVSAGCSEFTLQGNVLTGNTTGGLSDGSGAVTKSVANNIP